jgi:HPt (histidine-containing phosphotransfer) domain-containing protein
MHSEKKGRSSQPGEEEDDFGIAEIVPQYFALCQRDLLNLRDALDQNDFEKVRVLGHNLKGSGGAYGFPEITEIGSSLEASGKLHDTSLAKTGVDRLAAFLSARAPKE